MEIIDSEETIVGPKSFEDKKAVPIQKDSSIIEDPFEGLEEQFCMESKRLDPDKMTEKEREFFIKIKRKFPPLIPVSFRDIAEYGQTLGHQYPACVQWMRNLWKRGLVRRFVRGKWSNAVQGNVTGLWHGVHYSWK